MAFNSDTPLQSNQLPISIDFPKGNDENFQETLSLSYKRTADAVNTKKGSIFNLEENASFDRYFPTTTSSNTSNSFPFRSGYRKTFNLTVPIAPGATLTFAHGVTGLAKLTDMYGGCLTNAGEFLPLPYVSLTLAKQIEIKATTTTITLINGGSQGTITEASIVMEYLKTT